LVLLNHFTVPVAIVPAPHKKIDGEAVVRRATAVKNPLPAVSLSGSCGAATSGYYVLRRKI
jgi:hypothetical protein